MIEIMGYDACCPLDAILMSEGLETLQPTISIVGDLTVFRGFTPTLQTFRHYVAHCCGALSRFSENVFLQYCVSFYCSHHSLVFSKVNTLAFLLTTED